MTGHRRKSDLRRMQRQLAKVRAATPALAPARPTEPRR